MQLVAKELVCGTLAINGEPIGYTSAFTMLGLESVATVLGAPFNWDLGWMPYIAIGQGENAVSPEDTRLETEIWRKRGTVSSAQARYIVNARFGVAEPPDAYILREVGIFNKYKDGIMACRFLCDVDIDVAAWDEVDVTVTVWIHSFRQREFTRDAS